MLTDIQEDGNALQFDGAFKRYVKTEEFDEDKPNGYGKFKVFWLKGKVKRLLQRELNAAELCCSTLNSRHFSKS